MSSQALRCNGCERWLPADAFTPRPDIPRGYLARCRVCRNLQNKAWKRRVGFKTKYNGYFLMPPAKLRDLRRVYLKRLAAIEEALGDPGPAEGS